MSRQVSAAKFHNTKAEQLKKEKNKMDVVNKMNKKPALTAAERKAAQVEKEKLERTERCKAKGILSTNSTYTGSGTCSTTTGVLAKKAEKVGITGALGSIFGRRPVEKKEPTPIIYKLYDTCVAPDGFVADEFYVDKKTIYAARCQEPKVNDTVKKSKIPVAVAKKDSTLKKIATKVTGVIHKASKKVAPAQRVWQPS